MRVAHSNALAGLASSVAVALLVACGSSSGGGEGCQVDADCGSSGAKCSNGQCQLTLALTIVSPAQATFTNSSSPLPVKVHVAGGSPAAVTIWVDELEIVKVGPPYEYAWDTTTTAEGVHALWARVTAGSRSYDSPRVQVTVDRTPPAAPTIAQQAPTNAPLAPVQGTAEPGALITVYQGTTALATGTATACGAWSTELPLGQEGTYAFTATATDAAGNVSLPSAAVDQVVDRTAPAVVTRVPAPDATSVWSRDPITVTFSEPILASTVTAQSVLVSSQSAALLVPFALSADGRTLTISAPSPLLEVPAQLAASLTGLTDLAGNALPTTTWSWRLPEWLEISTALLVTGSDNSPEFKWAIASSGEGVVASEKGVIGCIRAIYRFHGSSWTNITTGLGRGDLICARGQSIAVDAAGHIVLAYLNINRTDSVRQLYVDRWQGSGWIPLGPSLNEDITRDAGYPVLRLDETDQPVVLWNEAGLKIKRWNGVSWDVLLNSTRTATTYELAVGANSRISVAHTSGTGVRLERISGTAPVAAPTALLGTAATEVAIAIDATGLEHIAYIEGGLVRTARPAPGELVPTWMATGGPFGTAAYGPSLAFRPGAAVGQQMVLGYVDTAPRVLAFNDPSWSSISGTIGMPVGPTGNFGSGLSTTANGLLSLAWSEQRTVVTLVSRVYNR